MNPWIYIDVAAFAVVAAISGIIIPQILLIAFRKNLFDEIDPRKIHKGAVPRLGGIAFFPAVMFTMLLLMGICLLYGQDAVVFEFYTDAVPLCFIICSIITLYLVGMADDLVGVKYRAKFVAQIFAAALVIMGGITLSNLHGFLWVHDLPAPVAIAATIVLTVFITNAINLIDGIDGLASGLSAIACLFYGFVCFYAGLHLYSMLAFATLGALVPFFYYNVFGNVDKQKKIFMGDTGSLTIGLVLSILSIKICSLNFDTGELNMGIAAFAPLLIPCCDVVRVYMRRIRNHKSPFLPDKTHIHHKLLALGMSQRVAMPVILLASLLLTGVNYILCDWVNITLLFCMDIAVWIIANILISRRIAKNKDK